MRRRGSDGWRRPHNAIEHKGGLADEQFQDLALKADIPKRHALEMTRIDRAGSRIMVYGGRHGGSGHDVLPAGRGVLMLEGARCRPGQESTNPVCNV